MGTEDFEQAGICGIDIAKLNGSGSRSELALTWKPVPGVEKTTPRGLLTLKKLAGRLLGAEMDREPLPVDFPTAVWQKIQPYLDSGPKCSSESIDCRLDSCLDCPLLKNDGSGSSGSG